jgi:hypothetical protein
MLRGSILVAVISLVAASPVLAADYGLAFVGPGDAMFVDMGSLKRVGGVVDFQFLRVTERLQTIMEEPLAARLYGATIDCENNEYRALSLVEIEEDGKAKPKEPLRGDAYPIALTAPEGALKGVVCEAKPELPEHAKSIVDAIKMGRAEITAAKAHH